MTQPTLQLVTHTIDPVFNAASRVLVLGTMPSPASRETGFFYGHPRNRFWLVLAAVFGEPAPQTTDDRRTFVLRNGIALWDVLASCEIHGASDASIANPVPNDLRQVLDAAPIERIFTTGATAYELYRKHCEPQTGITATKLPSTSPANASWSFDRLVEAYRVLREGVSHA